MNKTISTKEKLLTAARDLFWTRGYSNVSVRDITRAAGVDVALVSRYFGSKEGLFDATLAEIPRWSVLDATPEDVLEQAVASFSHPVDPETERANPFTMLLANIIDPEAGDKIRRTLMACMLDPLAARFEGDDAKDRAAMLLAALFGMALMRKTFAVPALAEKSPEEIAELTRRLAEAALR